MQKKNYCRLGHSQSYNLNHDWISKHVIMIRPFQFYCNEETISDNMYQTMPNSLTCHQIQQNALIEFDEFVNTLKQHKIKVTVIQDQGLNKTPDSIFPNNWISFHYKHKAIIYSMCAQNRRLERQIPLIQTIQKQIEKPIKIIYDYTAYEKSELFLEGTGSLVLDRKNKIAYACLSQRTNKRLVHKFCVDMGYQQCTFTASQYCDQKKIRVPIYHTNVLMSVSQKFALICIQLIHGEEAQNEVRKMLEDTNKQIIQLSPSQIKDFAANCLTVKNYEGKAFLIISEKGYKSLHKEQIQKIQKHVKIIHSYLRTIEKSGGGSARCMLAQFF